MNKDKYQENQKRMVSVIIPFFQQKEWLEEAIESVLQQTYKNIELIIINDGSNEDLKEIIEKYKEKILYISLEENKGPAYARNVGIKNAKGKYIAFLDADDLWLPRKLECQIAFMEETNVKWSHTGYFNWYYKNKKLVKKNNSRDYGNVYLSSFISLKAPTPSIVIKRECFEINKDFIFPEDMKHSQDSCLWSKIAYKYPLGLLDQPLVLIRQKGTNCDRSGVIRLKAKADIYEKIKSGYFKNVPLIISFIFLIYKIGHITIKALKKNDRSEEILSKIYWAFPFIIERILKLIFSIKEKNFNVYRRKIK